MNLFVLSSVIIFATSLGFGFFVYTRDTHSKLNQWWLFFSSSVAFWGLGLYGVTSATTEKTGMAWQYLLDVSATMIPVLYLFFISHLLRLKNLALRFTVLGLGVALSVFSFSPLFKTGLNTKFGFYWIEPGKFYALFPIFFFSVLALSLYFLLKTYRTTRDGVIKEQIKYQLLGAAVGFSGGLTDFLPQVFDIYPFGNYFVTLYVLFVGYSVISKRLFNVKTAAVELFAGGISLVFLFNLLSSETQSDWIFRFVLMVLVLFFSVLIVRGVYREVEQREKIEKLAAELQESNKRQEGLIHFISHEVKGYLTKSEAAFAGIVSGDFGEIGEDIKNFAATALAEDRKGVKAITDILQASNLKSGKVTYEKKPFSLKDLVVTVFDGFKSDALKKGLKYGLWLDHNDLCPVIGDEGKLGEHVIGNLIRNAILYTPSGEVNVYLKRNANKVVFSVKDSGVGILPEDMKKLFTEGGRGKDSIKINVHSTGYGLFIAKNIIEAHGGRIWAESEGPGKGTTFNFELPLNIT